MATMQAMNMTGSCRGFGAPGLRFSEASRRQALWCSGRRIREIPVCSHVEQSGDATPDRVLSAFKTSDERTLDLSFSANGRASGRLSGFFAAFAVPVLTLFDSAQARTALTESVNGGNALAAGTLASLADSFGPLESATDATNTAPEWLGLALVLYPGVAYVLFSLFREKVNPRASFLDFLFFLVFLFIILNIITTLAFKVRLY